MFPNDLGPLLDALRRLHPLIEAQETGRGARFYLADIPQEGVELICHTGGYPRQVRGEDARLACTVYNLPEAVQVLVKYLDDFAAMTGRTGNIGTATEPPLETPCFRHHVIGKLVNAVEGNPMNLFLQVGDLNGDNFPDIIVGGRNGLLAWWHNPGYVAEHWARHLIAPAVKHRSGCGTLHNLSQTPGADIIIGSDSKADTLIWYENPGTNALDLEFPWRSRTIVATGQRQFSQALVGEVTGEGEVSLVYLNQCALTDEGSVLARIPIPRDSTEEPWRDGETIARLLQTDNIPEEGLFICDLDGDGQQEIVAGGSWFKWQNGSWQAHRYLDPALGYVTTTLAAADINGDGQWEIVVCEGIRSIYHGPDATGRLAWFSPDDGLEKFWTEHRLMDDLRDARGLQIGNVCGLGYPDIVVGEAGIRQRPAFKPRLMVLQNDGRGSFVLHLIDRGIGTQQVALSDLENRGRLDIVGIPTYGEEKWLVHVWRQEEL